MLRCRSKVCVRCHEEYASCADQMPNSWAEETPPLAVDLMSGPNEPVALALRWCGWRTISVDLELHGEWDTILDAGAR